jgi:hypothetical protein
VAVATHKTYVLHMNASVWVMFHKLLSVSFLLV